MIFINEVVPLFHKNKKIGRQEEYYDGTGFLIEINEESVLVTCKHNFVLSEEIFDYFIYENTHYPIDRISNNFLISKQKDDRHYDTQTGCLKIFEDDYAFLRLPNFKIKHPIILKTTLDIKAGEHLLLVTHELETGKQVKLFCKREFFKEKVSKLDESDNPGDYMNLIHLVCNDCKRGYSGGAIIHEETGTCIGFLHAGQGNEISILKAQTIIERYIELKRHTI